MGNLIDFAQREALDSRENEIRSILFHYSFFPTNKHITKGWIPYESEMSITIIIHSCAQHWDNSATMSCMKWLKYFSFPPYLGAGTFSPATASLVRLPASTGALGLH